MHKIDMSAKAVTARLKRVAQLRRLGLSLQQAKIIDPKIVERHPATKNTSASEKQKQQ
jgi:hypothetical protein